jgi:hypothetical protein
MTILNVKTARAIWLVDSRDLNPRGIDIVPVIEAIKVRYSFQVYPNKSEEVNENDPKGIIFQNGSFATGSGRYTIAKATMYGDGIVVDSALSTDFSEAFLADALTFLSSQFGFTYRPDMIHRKIFLSELIVRPEKDLSSFFSPLDAVNRKLNSLTGFHFQPFGFSLADDKTGTGSPAPFRFEREVGKPTEQHRYYSCAPIRTADHEELLKQLESLL